MAFFDTTPSACSIDDLLNFNIDKTDALITNAESFLPSSAPVFISPECEDDEELEWLSNEDVFPSVDTFVPCVEPFVDMMSLDSNTSTTTLKHESPDSVLENSNPVITTCFTGRRPRTTRRRVQGSLLNISSQQWFIKASETSEGISGRKCKHCGSEKTPQWRAGPEGPKTLCNACGVRYKSGRLCAEYRPANSPTFLSAMHSSSHRKIIEMRKLKQQRTIANGSGNFNGA